MHICRSGIITSERKYNRLCFVPSPAPVIFQTFVDNLVAGIPGVAAYLDDIIVTGRSIEDQLSNLRRVPSALHDYRLKFQMNLFAFFEVGRVLHGSPHFKIRLAHREDMAHEFRSSQPD